MMPSAIEVGDQSTPWKIKELVNVCPPCFDFSDEDEDRTIQIIMDGNIQQAQLKKDTPCDFGIVEPKLIFDNVMHKFVLGKIAHEHVNTSIPSNVCGLKCMATNGWNSRETITATNKVLHESGVVGITCFYPINLRFLNIYSGGERQSHGIRLIEAVLHEVPHLADLKFCYDVACMFQSAPYCYNPDWIEVFEGQIGRFHIYGQEYRCHVLYNLLHKTNYCLMVGEEPENLGYMMQHLIWSGRVLSSSCQMPKIHSFGRYWPIQLDLFQC